MSFAFSRECSKLRNGWKLSDSRKVLENFNEKCKCLERYFFLHGKPRLVEITSRALHFPNLISIPVIGVSFIFSTNQQNNFCRLWVVYSIVGIQSWVDLEIVTPHSDFKSDLEYINYRHWRNCYLWVPKVVPGFGLESVFTQFHVDLCRFSQHWLKRTSRYQKSTVSVWIPRSLALNFMSWNMLRVAFSSIRVYP